MKKRIILKIIRWLLLFIPYYDVAYKEHIAGDGQRVYKARKRRKDATWYSIDDLPVTDLSKQIIYPEGKE